jgi:hypothetical protein
MKQAGLRSQWNYVFLMHKKFIETYVYMFNVRTVHCLIGYNGPTLCTDYHFFIYYSDSYMFRHLCVIFRERPLSLWVTWKFENGCVIGMYPCTVNVGGLCAPDVVVSCVTLSSWAHMHALSKPNKYECTNNARLQQFVTIPVCTVLFFYLTAVVCRSNFVVGVRVSCSSPELHS